MGLACSTFYTFARCRRGRDHFVRSGFRRAPPVEANLAEKPPVETIAIWSPRDGIVSPRASRGRPGERDKAIAVRCNHVGFPNSPECIRAVLEELDNFPAR